MNAIIHKDQLAAFQSWKPETFETPHRTGLSGHLPTAERVERVYQEATEQGYHAGFAEGVAAGREHAARIAALVKGVEAELATLDQGVAEDLLQLALGIARQVVTTALAVKPELLIPLVREAVQNLPYAGSAANLLLNPDDAALIKSALGEQLAQGGMKIIEDRAIARGGCRIESAGSTIDAALSTRWQRVLEAMGADPAWLG